MHTKALIYFLIVGLFCACNTEKPIENPKEEMIIIDTHSFAKPEEAVITHLNLDLKVDFEKRILKGSAELDIKKSKEAKELFLDTKGLHIFKVTLDDNQETEYELGEDVDFLGQEMRIKLDESTKKVRIDYETSPDAAAVQWLTPAQTAGKEYPFLFTQSQAILARSWIPLQDSPGIRFTYSAKIKVPEGLLAVMSASNPQETSPDGVYTFEMKQPIPSYLMALAVGNLVFHPIGTRAGVYAEPEMIEKSAYEFAELEEMIVAAENLYGPYSWERYDLLVLPPSFPFGGMENPRLTFATPTILAGDRSLVSLVAHELAHSWSGNLVTNATWDDFWLNEGFTVYFENRIMEALYGKAYAEMLASISLQDLNGEMDEMITDGNGRDTWLKLDLKGRDPDDGMTSIAYDKGYFFLRTLEQKVGREKFDAFLKTYFKENAFQVMTTEAFVAYLNTNLFEANQMEVDSAFIQNWIYDSGLPEDFDRPVSDRFALVDQAVVDWQSGTAPSQLDTKNWSAHEWLHFVRSLPADMTVEQMTQLDGAYHFTETGNNEVLDAWLLHVIRHDYEPGYDRLEDFLINTGRRKFLTPLYTELIKTDEGKKKALIIYEKARPNYHFVATQTFDQQLGWTENE